MITKALYISLLLTGYVSLFKSKSLLFIVLFLVSSTIFSQKTHIPDANFRRVLQSKYSITADANDSILNSSVANITDLNISHKSIVSLSGIGAFTSLVGLYCDTNQLTSLDVSANTALMWLVLGRNQLTSLDLSANTALAILSCKYNALTSLDISSNTALTTLDCYNNQLTSLDVSANTALKGLHCDNNSLSALDISANTALTRLYCAQNQLTSLDVSTNTALVYLDVFRNRLTDLDVSSNTALTYLNCSRNQLTDLDVSASTALTILLCYNNRLISLNVKNGNNRSLTNFRAYTNGDVTCIQVDDVAWSEANWRNDVETTAMFSEDGDCDTEAPINHSKSIRSYIGSWFATT